MTLDEEMAKARYVHGLEVRRTWLDKFLIAVLIGLTGVVGNFVFEGYKNDLAKTQFLLENRLLALKEIRASYSELVQHAYLEATRGAAADSSSYAKAVEAFTNVSNQWGFLFSANFDRQLMHYAWLHQSMADPQVHVTRQGHWEFIYDFSQAFDMATRTALNVEILGAPREVVDQQFELEMWNADDVNAKGTLALFSANLAKWQRQRKGNRTP